MTSMQARSPYVILRRLGLARVGNSTSPGFSGKKTRREREREAVPALVHHFFTTCMSNAPLKVSKVTWHSRHRQPLRLLGSSLENTRPRLPRAFAVSDVTCDRDRRRDTGEPTYDALQPQVGGIAALSALDKIPLFSSRILVSRRGVLISLWNAAPNGRRALGAWSARQFSRGIFNLIRWIFHREWSFILDEFSRVPPRNVIIA